ncbi:hypothetical protein Golax_025760, partial [Gossypium laxum]|nr:hypothetical protein [Gossypium laxum]
VGDHISIWNDRWVPGVTEDRLQNNNSGESIRVEDTADLAFKTIHEDIQLWRGEATGIFSVRSAYKLLQESTVDPNDYLQADSKNFYRKLWNLHMPSKIKITVWKIAWNYIPTFSNLKLKRVMTEGRCSRCGQEEEDSFHVFQRCPIVKEIWSQLNFSWGQMNSAWDFAAGCGESGQEGRIVEAKSFLHDNVASPFVAEAHAGFQATRLGIQLGYHTIDIIGDSRRVITKCQSGSRDKLEIGAIISDIQSLKEFFQKVRFYFIPRSENVESHRLAKRSLQKREEKYLVGETSRSICDEPEPNRLGYSD